MPTDQIATEKAGTKALTTRLRPDTAKGARFRRLDTSFRLTRFDWPLLAAIVWTALLAITFLYILYMGFAT